MEKIIYTYRNSLMVARKYKSLLFFLAMANIVFFFFGQWMASKGLPGVIEFRKEVFRTFPELLSRRSPSETFFSYIALQVLYTFLFNLIVGAFLSTAVPGIIFFLPYLITVLRAWSVGVIFYGLLSDPIVAIAFYGTFLLEFGAYVLAAAIGIDIGLSVLSPSRKRKKKRRDAMASAIRDSIPLYVLIATLLLVSAVWETGWLNFIGINSIKDLTLIGGKGIL